MNPSRLVFLIALILGLPLQAQEKSRPPEAKEPPPPEFLAECQMVTIPGRLVPTLVPELNDETKTGAAVQKLQAMIARGEATLTAHFVARGAFGEKVTAESVEVVRYPMRFEPPLLPANTASAVAGGAKHRGHSHVLRRTQCRAGA